MKITLTLALLTCSFGMFAQTAEEIQKIFPGTDMVYQDYQQELNIFIKNDEPVAEKKTNINMLMLTEKNVNMLSRYRVYHSSFSELTDLSAYTKVPAGGKYKTVKVTDKKTTSSTDNSIFYDDMKETTFDFPSLTQFAVAHVDYTQFHKDAHLLSAFYLPGYMPVVNASFTVTVPDNVNIKYVIKNDPKGLWKLTEEKKKRETVYKWTISNVKPEDNYSNAPDMRYFQPHVIVYITSYENKNGRQQYLSTIDDLHRWNTSFLKDLNLSPDPALKKIVDSITSDKTSERAKAAAIYSWVQQHIKYVAFENGVEGFRPRQASEVCAKRYGDCKDMSSILTQMMRMAGIKAYYTWIGTRELPYTYTETPLPIVDNHMISTALIDGEYIFLDGTDNNASFDMPPAFIQGKEALISINDKEYKVMKVSVADPAKSMIIDSTFISMNDKGLKGYQNVLYNGYFGKDVYSSLLYRDETETKEYINKRMSKGSNKFILGNYKINKLDPGQNIASISAEFEIPGYSKKVGSEYYINLHLEKIFGNNVINIEERKVPYEVDYNYTIRQYHILTIPEGYKVSYMPKDYSFENELVQINLYYKMDNGKLIAAQEIQNKKLLLDPSDFEEWNKPMKALQPYYKESVVLEKK